MIMATEKLNMGIEIDKKLIEKNVSDTVCAAIASSLGNGEELVRKAVQLIVTSYVDENGRERTSGGYGAKPYLKYLAEQTIKNTVQEEVAKMVEENKDAFAKAIRDELYKPNVRKQPANSFIGAILETTKSTWRMPITIQMQPYQEE